MKRICLIKLSFLVLFISISLTQAQTSITYQGRLNDGGVAANGVYDFTFRLFSAASGGTQIGTDVFRDDVQVINGVFTVNLDFGASPFTSATGNFLEISVRAGTSTGTFTPLAPRLPVSSSPYSIKSLNADNALNSATANNALSLGGVAASEYVTNSSLGNSVIRNQTTLQPSANFNISGNGLIANRLGVGTTTPNFKVEIIDSSNTGLRVQTNIVGGTVASFGGMGEFVVDAPFIPGGRFRITENGNVGIGGTVFSDSRLTVSGTGIVRSTVNSDSNAGFRLNLNNSARWSVATVTGGNFQIFNDFTGQNAFFIDGANNNVGIGTTSLSAKLTISGGNERGLAVSTNNNGSFVAQFGALGSFGIDSLTNGGGRFFVDTSGRTWINMPPTGVPANDTSGRFIVNGVIKTNFATQGVLPVCYSIQNYLAGCSSSIKFKENIYNFTSGLEIIRRLRPVSFNWKEGGMRDLGLIAEEVAETDPLLATYDQNGQIQGVKYDRIGVVLVNAVNEQQAQIEAQQKKIDEQNELIKKQTEELERQRKELDALKKLVCAANPTAEICKEER